MSLPPFSNVKILCTAQGPEGTARGRDSEATKRDRRVVQRIPVMKEGQLEGGEKEDSGEGTGEGREGEGEEEEVERHSSSREGVG